MNRCIKCNTLSEIGKGFAYNNQHYCAWCYCVDILSDIKPQYQNYNTTEHKEMIMTYDDKTLETNK